MKQRQASRHPIVAIVHGALGIHDAVGCAVRTKPLHPKYKRCAQRTLRTARQVRAISHKPKASRAELAPTEQELARMQSRLCQGRIQHHHQAEACSQGQAGFAGMPFALGFGHDFMDHHEQHRPRSQRQPPGQQ